MSRPSWEQYFMEIAQFVASRSTCLRRKVGAVIVKDRRILTTGYNGAPKGLAHCEKTGCLRIKMNIPSGEHQELCRGLHAEQNAIIQAAMHGVSIQNSHIYCTDQPCITCVKMIINAGITRIYYLNSYPDQLARDLIVEAGIEEIHYE